MTIAKRLDAIFTAACVACDTPYKRAEAKWIDGLSRSICSACGLDQASSEAHATAKQRNSSWIIVSRETGKPVLETWSRETAARVNTARYEVLTASEWLQRFNRSVRDARP